MASMHLPSRRFGMHMARWRRSLSFSACSCSVLPTRRAKSGDREKQRRPARPEISASRSRTKLAINGIGAVATGIALVVILAAKFAEGAWLTVIVIPCTILLLRLVRRYYDEIDRQV